MARFDEQRSQRNLKGGEPEGLNCMLREKARTIVVDCWSEQTWGSTKLVFICFRKLFHQVGCKLSLLIDLCISPEIEYIWRSRIQVELQSASGFKNCEAYTIFPAHWILFGRALADRTGGKWDSGMSQTAYNIKGRHWEGKRFRIERTFMT